MKQKYSTTAAVLFALFTLLLSSCEQPDGPVGSGVGSEQGGQTYMGVFNVAQDTSFYNSDVKTGASAHIYIGKYEGILAEGLMKFYRPILPAQWTIDTAYVKIGFQSGIGTGGAINVASNLLDLEWSEAEPPALADLGALDQNNYPDPIAITADSGVVAFPVNREWVDQWLRWENNFTEDDTTWTDTLRADSSLTLHLFSDDEMPELLKRFRARGALTDTLRPRLFIQLTVEDTATGDTYPDMLMTTANADIFLLENSNSNAVSDLLIGSGCAYQSNLRFDVSDIYARHDDYNVAVNKATMTIFRKREIAANFPPTLSLWPFRLTDELGFTMPDSAGESGFVYISTAIDTTLDSLEIDVTIPASEWIRSVDKNHGIAIHSGTESLDINRMAFYSMEEQDTTLHPRLTLYYTEIPR